MPDLGGPPAGRTLIEVEGLTKRFRRPRRVDGRFGTLRTLVTRQYVETRSVDGISFTIDEGETVGYLGPNGAGKSTTVKMLTGALVPTSGTVRVAGLVPWQDRQTNARRIGVVFGQRSQLWWDLPLVESLRLIAALYDLPQADYLRSLRELTDLLGLGPFLGTPVRQLSLGQRMRGDIAAAVIHRPRILFLDEPTVGLDVLAKDAVRAFVTETNRAGRTTILLTTHDLADVRALCKRIIVIDSGRILHDGSAAELVASHAPPPQVAVVLAGGHQPETIRVGRYVGVRRADGSHVFMLTDRDDIAELMVAVTGRHAIRGMTVVESDLDSVIKQIYAERRSRTPAG